MELVTQALVSIMAIMAIVVGLSAAAYWIVAFYAMHGREKEKELPRVSVPGDIQEVFSGVPAALIIFFILIGISLISYVIAVWQYGVSY